MSSQPESTAPAPRALAQLMASKGLSTRKLAAATREVDGKGIAYQTIGNIRRGDDDATPRVLSLIAKAAGVGEDYFAEVRLARARHQIDEREVGLEQALENLRRLNPPDEGDDRPPGGPLGPPEPSDLRPQGGDPKPADHEQPSVPAKRRRRSA